MEDSKNYITSDLYLTAFLKTKGHTFSIEKNKGKYDFIFDVTPELSININNYLSGNGNCEPLSFTNSIKNLKNYLYNNR